MDASDTELVEAVAFVRDEIEKSKAGALHRAHFQNFSLQTFRNILKQPDDVLKARSDIKQAFLSFYRERRLPAEYALYRVLLQAMEIGDQSGAEKYLGKYKCYRLSNEPNKFIEGTIEIKKSPGGRHYFFEHTSKQSITEGDVVELFNHRGPVYVLSNRIYLVGVGVDNYGAYLRPIMLRSVDDPRRREMSGIVLSETAIDHVSLASKTVLVHEACEAILRQSYPEDEFSKFIDNKLRNQWGTPDMLYGGPRKRS